MDNSLLDNSSPRMAMIEDIRRRQSIDLSRVISSKDKDRDMGSSKEADMESLPALDVECELLRPSRTE
jgi:histidinol phosphatase-like enzyme